MLLDGQILVFCGREMRLHDAELLRALPRLFHHTAHSGTRRFSNAHAVKIVTGELAMQKGKKKEKKDRVRTAQTCVRFRGERLELHGSSYLR